MVRFCGTSTKRLRILCGAALRVEGRSRGVVGCLWAVCGAVCGRAKACPVHYSLVASPRDEGRTRGNRLEQVRLVRFRRPIAVVAAVALLFEGAGLAAIQWALAIFVEEQSMSLDGIEAETIALVARVGGLLLVGYLALVAGLLLHTALRERPLGKLRRVLVISCAVTHGVLGVVAVALVGWGAFLLLMTVLALQIWTLLGYAPPELEPEPRETADQSPPPVPAK